MEGIGISCQNWFIKKIKGLDLGAELLCKNRCLVTPLDISALSFSFGYHLKVMYGGFYHG